jgi:outer membrane protein
MLRMGLLVAFCTCHLSLVTCHSAWAEELKIGYVNVGAVLDGYQRTKESEQALEQKVQKKQAELEARAAELKKMRESLELLSAQAREAKAKELEEKSDEFQRLKTRSQRDLVRERNVAGKSLLDEIGAVITDYAKTNGFAVMLDQRSLVYGQEAYDVTDEVLKLLNERYAAKKSSTAPR